MKLWISSESEADVGDLLRLARLAVEIAINDVIEKKDYDLPVDAWDCICIVRSDELFSERTMFSKKKRDMDFRLRIPHKNFIAASPLDREKMVFEMLQRSLSILRSTAGEAPGFEPLIADITAVAATKGWIELGKAS